MKRIFTRSFTLLFASLISFAAGAADFPYKANTTRTRDAATGRVGQKLYNDQFNFSTSNLKGVTLENPTSLQFGPDKRLYVAELAGLIKVYTIKRNASNDYSATTSETINLINQIPNHNDDGSVASYIITRQITGILVAGTAANPIIYVSSSDSRMGGPDGDTNLDTNSGMVSRISWTGSTWVKVDLIRGLPRSEENHANNGMQLDPTTNTLYLAVGGLTNAGAPSINFAYLCEYALSAAILSIDLNKIEAMPTKGSGNTAYKYDIPTLDDPTRPNRADGTDENDPFGGNDGLNQAKIVPGGPVQVYASGYRNVYDLVITKNRQLYTIDNGANQGWGGYPANEGPNGTATNQYVPGEPGSTGPGVNDPQINNLDNLHYVGAIDSYVPGSHYGGHPNPIRANPVGAGLYTHNGTTGVWRTSKTSTSNPLPVDWPPVPIEMAHKIEGDYQNPGEKDDALLTFTPSTNGIAEYTASNFNGALKGNLLAAAWDGSIFRIKLNAEGTDVTNQRATANKLNQEAPFASGFGSLPLDVVAQGDGDIFPGTVWAAAYGSGGITIFEPQDFVLCTGAYNTSDEDKDGYTNADEIDSNTNPCSAASKPEDHDSDFISDLNDPDDDNDGLPDSSDLFALDSQNGLGTTLPLKYDLFNNNPGTGLFGVGFTGLMSNQQVGNNYRNAFDKENLIAGGAVGAFTVVNVGTGDALGTLNNQQNGFQFGVNVDNSTGPFTVQARMLGSFFNDKVPQNFQSQGVYIGTGDQDNYLKITLNANNGKGGMEVVYENAGTPVTQQFELVNGIPKSTVDLYFVINPVNGTVQPKYAADGSAVMNLGNPITISGALLNVLQGTKALAVGTISTSRGATPFTATWDFIYITKDQVAATGAWESVVASAGAPTERHESAFVQAGDKFYMLGGRGIKNVQVYDPKTKSWSNKAPTPIELHHFQAVTLDGLIYVVGGFTGGYPYETPLTKVYIYDPLADKWKDGPAIPVDRRRGSAGVVVHNKKIYVAGGIINGHADGHVAWFDEYDPSTNTWKKLVDAPRTRDHFHAAIVNNKLYLAGGRRSSYSTGQTFELTVPEVDVYDFATSKWSTLASSGNIPTPRAGTATAVLGDEVIVIGGESGLQTTAHKEVEALNVTTNTWRKLADLLQGRHGTQAIVSNGGIYIAAGSGGQGGSPELNTQEAFYFFSPTSPTGNAIAQSQLTAPATVDFGKSAVNTTITKTIKFDNTNGNQGILVTGISLTGSDAYSYTSPYTLPVAVAAGSSLNVTVTFKATTAGAYTGELIVAHSGVNGSTKVTLSSTGETVSEPVVVHRVNAGGGALSTSLGSFSQDKGFSPSPGNTFSSTGAIANTSDDALYQTERYGTSGAFSYALPVESGTYQVVLHFAELYWGAAGQRVFDVSLEQAKVLNDYDIYKKAGSFAATTETFTVTVTDGTLNLYFSALATDGGKDQPKVSAIEVIRTSGTGTPTNQAPVANAGADKSITLPTNSTTLNGSGTDTDGSITAYAWSQVSGPNTATFSSKTVAAPTVSNLIEGSYTFSLVVTDDKGLQSSADQVVVSVVKASAEPLIVKRINAGGEQVSTSMGVFSADANYSPAPGFTFSKTVSIAGTSDDALYQSERSSTADNGSFSYNIPVSNGTYQVVLHFAELYWWAAGQRVFDVSAETIKVLDNYDIYKKAGSGATAVKETITVEVKDGQLNLLFSASAADGGINRPKVSAIEVIQTSGNTPTNQAPVANAGADKTVTAAADGQASVKLDGSASSDPDGSIVAYSWAKGSTALATGISPTISLAVGSHTITLTVTDDKGATASDQVIITVNAGQVSNQAPVANAGPDQTVTAGTDGVASVKMDASKSTDTDGQITAYNWTEAGIQLATGISPTLVLKQGVHTITLTVTDDKGANATDNVVVTVNTPTTTNQKPIANAGPDKAITLPTNSTTLQGSGTDADGSITAYAWSQVSGPGTATFNSKTVAVPTVSNLLEGSYTFSLVVMDDKGLQSNPDQVVVSVLKGSTTPVVVHRVNAGGGALNISMGSFSADKGFTPSPGNTFSSTGAIANTSDDALYQTERYGTSGTFSYALPVESGTYQVVLHFAELYWGAAGQRVFDVSLEQNKVLNDYDIYKKAGSFAATTETFTVTVTDGTLNLYFSAHSADGGKDQPKVSAIEVIRTSGTPTNQAPVANAGADKSITLPTNSTTLNGSGTDTDGSITAYAWSQVSGPNTATFSSKTVAAPTVSNLIEGSYTFSLVVTDDKGLQSSADQVVVSVVKTSAEPVAVAIRINAGGPEVTLSNGVKFIADKYYTGNFTYQNQNISDIAGTTDDVLYKSERSSDTNLGSFAYNIPVTNGTYKVRLHFAEIYWGAGGKGSRVFSVNLEGGTVELPNYDIVAAVGPLKADIKEYTVTVADQMLNITFSASADRPKVSAIEVIPQTTSTQALTSGNPARQPALTVYPNPSTGDKVTLQLTDLEQDENVNVLIYDMQGRVVQETAFKADGAGSMKKELVLQQNLNKGMYMLVVYSAKGRVQSKLIIQ